MAEPISTKVERTRTFTGCRTCRRRHTKCDERRPTCKPCHQSGLVCGGYAPRLIWANEVAGQDLQTLGDEEPQTRFPLFSNSERASLSKQLSQSLGARAVEDILLDVKASLRSHRKNGPAFVHIGPFGAFQTSSTSARSENVSSASPDSAEVEAEADADTNMTIEEADSYDKRDSRPSHLDFLDLDNLDNFDNLDNLDDLDISFPIDIDLDISQSLAAGPDIPLDLRLEQPTESRAEELPAFEQNLESKAVPYTDAHFWGGLSSNSIHHAPSPNSQRFISSVLKDAPLLLRHYKKHIDSSSDALQARRISPWQIVFLPCAFQTLGELTSLGTTTYVKLAILSAILSRSALHFGQSGTNVDEILHWRNVGANHSSNAQYYLRKALTHDSAEPGEAAYENLLMAFLAVTLALLYQCGRATRRVLRDAERLVCFRGYTSRKSQTTRILHHVYTYLRVLVESVPDIDQAQDDDEDGTVTLAIRTKPTTFRITEEALNVGLDPDYQKTAEVGYGDYHLEIQGRWDETLHCNIHGVPESLMTLLAQTTSLANEIPRFEVGLKDDSELCRKLRVHKKTLEERIWSWCLDTNLRSKFTQDPNEPMQSLIEHPQAQKMVQALHQALIIYFYRRVYGVSPRVLQGNVQQGLSDLEACMEGIATDEAFTPCLAWATMIIASAATSEDNKRQALSCVQIIDVIGFHYTDDSLEEVINSTWASAGL